MKPDFYEISSYILEHSDDLDMLKKGHSNYPPQIFFEISCGVLLQHMLNKMPGTYDIYQSDAKYRIINTEGFSGLCEFFKLNNKKLFNKPNRRMFEDSEGIIHIHTPSENAYQTIAHCISNFESVIAKYGLTSLKTENQYGSPHHIKDLSPKLGTEAFLYRFEYLYKPGVVATCAFSALINNKLEAPCFYKRLKTEGLDDYSAISKFEKIDLEKFLIAHMRHNGENNLVLFFNTFKFDFEWIDSKLANKYANEKNNYFDKNNSLSSVDVLKVLMILNKMPVDSSLAEQIDSLDLDYKTAKQFLMSKNLVIADTSNLTDINLTY